MSNTNFEIRSFTTDNALNIPHLPRVDSFPEGLQWIRFSDIRFGQDLQGFGVHFYEDDSKFEVIWNQPNKYIATLKTASAVLMPDFSLYWDMPLMVQMWNKYRNHWIARYWLEKGITVIPSVNLSTFDIWHLTILGFPKNSVLVTSSIGASQTGEEIQYTQDCIDYIKRTLAPTDLFLFTRSRVGYQGVRTIQLPYKGVLNYG